MRRELAERHYLWQTWDEVMYSLSVMLPSIAYTTLAIDLGLHGSWQKKIYLQRFDYTLIIFFRQLFCQLPWSPRSIANIIYGWGCYTVDHTTLKIGGMGEWDGCLLGTEVDWTGLDWTHKYIRNKLINHWKQNSSTRKNQTQWKIKFPGAINEAQWCECYLLRVNNSSL